MLEYFPTCTFLDKLTSRSLVFRLVQLAWGSPRAAAVVMAARRINEHDIRQAGSIHLLIGQLIDQVKAGNTETKEYGCQLLRSLTDQPAKLELHSDKSRNRDHFSLGATAASMDDTGIVAASPGQENNALNLEAATVDHCIMIAQAGGIKPLVALLKEGSANGQRDACGALANIARGSTEYQQKVVDAGGVTSMAALLRNGDASAAEQAAAGLASISQCVGAQKLIISSGAVPPLVNLLKVNQRFEAQIRAAEALANLAQNSDEGCEAVAKAGAIPRILELLGTGKAMEACSRALAKLAHSNVNNQNEICKLGGIAKLLPPLSGVNVEAQVAAASALAELASGERCRKRQDAIAKSGGIRPLLQLVQSRYSPVQCMALHALAELTTNNRENQDAIDALEGLPPLVHLISAGVAPPQVQTYAARALAALVKHNEKNQDKAMDQGAISLLVSLIRQTTTPSVEAEVAGALYSLGEGHPKNQSAIISAGAIPVLVGLIGSRSDHAARLSANALSSLGLDNHDSQAEMTKLLVNLLTTAKREATQERAAAALWRLVRQNPGGQALIAASGGAQPLVRLLREGVESAKAFALWSLSLCITDENRQVMIEAGVIGPLVDLLTSDDASVTEQSARALGKLCCAGSSPAERRKTLVAVQSHGAIAPLVALLDGPVISARQHAAAALSELALVPGHRKVIELCGGIPPLVKVLNDPHADGKTKKYAAAAVGLLSVGEDTGDTNPPLSQQQQRQQQRQQSEGSETTSPVPSRVSQSIAGSPELNSTLSQSESPTIGRVAGASKRGPSRQITIVAEGAIAPLVNLLSKGEAEQEEASGALRALADNPAIRNAITESGGIRPLVMMLGGSNPKARENAEGALVRLSTEIANRVLIIQQLVGMLQDSSTAAREQAAAAIANLARESTANCTSIVEAGGIPPLLRLLTSESAKAKENSASAISQLARGSRPNQNAIGKAGGIPLLVGTLTASSSNKGGDASQGQIETIVLHTIWNLAKKNFANQVALVEAGAIAPLVQMLGNASAEMQLPATGAIECLLHAKDIQASIVRTGAIAPLCTLARDGMIETQEQASAALWSLSTDNLPNKTTVAKLGGIEALVKMVATGGSDKAQRNAAGALTTLASRHEQNREAIAKRIVRLLMSDQGLYGKVDTAVTCRALVALTRMCGRKMADDETQSHSLSADDTANQLALFKAGGVGAIIGWLSYTNEDVQREAAHALLAMAIANVQTQAQIVKVEGLAGLIGVINSNNLEAQKHAAVALWHLAYSTENQLAIAEAGGIPALVSMLGAAGTTEGARGAELACATLVRLVQGNPKVSVAVAEAGGIPPLVLLLKTTNNASQQAAAALAELSLVAHNRDPIINAGGVEPLLKLLNNRTVGTPETAARALAHLARSEGSLGLKWEDIGTSKPSKGVELHNTALLLALANKMEFTPQEFDLFQIIGLRSDSFIKCGNKFFRPTEDETPTPLTAKEQIAGTSMGESTFVEEDEDGDDKLRSMTWDGTRLGSLMIQGPQARRHYIKRMGGVRRLVAMLDGSNLFSEAEADKKSPLARWGKVSKFAEEMAQHAANLPGDASSASGIQVGMMEQAAAALAELTFGDVDLQDAVIDANGIPKLLQLVVGGSALAQEHAAASLWHISTSVHNQARLVMSGCIPVLVPLVRSGSPIAQEAACGALANLARGESTWREAYMAWKAATAAQVTAELMAAADAKAAANAPPPPSPVPPSTAEEAAQSPLDMAVVPGTTTTIAHERVALTWRFNIVRKASSAGEPILYKARVSAVYSTSEETAPISAAGSSMARLDEGEQKEAPAGVPVKTEEIKAAVEDDGLSAIVKANGIPQFVSLLGDRRATPKAKELAASALWHLALNSTCRDLIAQAGGIAPLVGLLDGGTHKAHRHASDALARLANENREHQSQIAKRLVSLLMANKAGGLEQSVVQERAAHALQMLASDNPGSTSVIVKAGAVSPLVHLLSTTSAEGVKKYTLEALQTLLADSDNKLVVADLVVLVGAGSSNAQALVVQMLMTLADDKTNRIAIVQSGALPKLVLQLDSAAVKVQEMAAAVISKLVSDSKENVEGVAAQGGIPRFVTLLTSTSMQAQAYAAAVLAIVCQSSDENHRAVLASGCVPLLVQMLTQGGFAEARAEAAAALANLSMDHEKTGVAQREVVGAGAVQPLVELLHVDHSRAQRKSAVALMHLAADNRAHQDAVRLAGGIQRLVNLLSDTGREDVQAAGAAALAELASGNKENQTAIADVDGLPRLVRLLQEASMDRAVEAASASLRRLAAGNSANQIMIAAYGGILPLILKLGSGNEMIQEETAEALANLANKNEDNEATIATLLIKLLFDRATAARGARVIANLGAQLGTSFQNAVARFGGLHALATLLTPEPLLTADGQPDESEGRTSVVVLQLEAAGALRSMAAEHPGNQLAIANVGAIPLLIQILTGDHGSTLGFRAKRRGRLQVAQTERQQTAVLTEGIMAPAMKGSTAALHYNAAAALWKLAADSRNQRLIDDSNGIMPLVLLLKTGNEGAQESSAGALRCMASTPEVRDRIAAAGAISPLAVLIEKGVTGAKDQAAGCLSMLATESPINQDQISLELFRVFETCTSLEACEYAARVACEMSLDQNGSIALEKANMDPHLVRMVLKGTDVASDLAARALAGIANVTPESRSTVMSQLILARHEAEDPKASMRIVKALKGLETKIGLKWKDTGATRLAEGTELHNEALSAALEQKLISDAALRFTWADFEQFGLRDGSVTSNCFIRVGSKFFQPSETDADDPFSLNTFGLKWEEVGSTGPVAGTEIVHPGLAAALQHKTEFGPTEFDNFGLRDVTPYSFIKVGDKFFQPAEDHLSQAAAGMAILMFRASTRD